MKFKIYKFKSVTSTNEVAINLIKKEKKEIGYIYADSQTKGRGTHGREWISQEGNLFGTIFFQLKNNFGSKKYFWQPSNLLLTIFESKFLIFPK